MSIDYLSEWGFVADAYNGTGGFSSGKQIEKFSRESDDRYDDRAESAQREYENIFDSKVSRYIGYLFKTTPLRESINPLLTGIKDDANRRNESADVFFSNFAKNAKVRGVNLLLVDSPTQKADNMDDQIKRRLTPYFVEILPERVTEYKLDDFGNFEYVAFTDTINESTYKDTKVTDIIRYYDKEVWRVYDTEGLIIDEQPHGVEECPVLIFSEKGLFESMGEFSQLAGMSKRLYNLESELKLLLRGQTFSILTIWTEKGAKPEISLGVDNALLYSGDHPPAFISSDAAQAKTYEDKIIKVREAMDRVSYDVSTSASKESGIALEIKFESLNASLKSFSQRMESLERKAWDIVTDKLGMSRESINIVYNMDFTVSDILTEISTLDGINAIVDLPQYKAVKLKSIVKEDLKSVETETLDDIFEEIDNVAKMGEVSYNTGE